MTKIQQKIKQMGEYAVRKLLKQAYHSPSRGSARIVTENGSIRSIGNNDHESYSIQAEHANSVIQYCQSRLNEIYSSRHTLGQQLVIHNLVASLSRQQQRQMALRKIIH